MLLTYKGDGIQATQYIPNNDLEYFKYTEAASYGYEILWKQDPIQLNLNNPCEQLKIYCDKFFSLTFDLHIKTLKNQMLMIIPHYSHNMGNYQGPIPLHQIIQTDWWTGKLEILFIRNKIKFDLSKGMCLAQAICVPKGECKLKEMQYEDCKKINEANAFLEANKDQYITRKDQIKDNLYEVLSNHALRGTLPSELRDKVSLGCRLIT